MERAIIAISALLLNAALGGPRRWYAAAGLVRFSRMPAHLVRSLERKLNRTHRSLRERQWRGTLLAAVILSLAVLAGLVFHAAFTANLRFAELLLLSSLLPVRPTRDCAADISRHLLADDLHAARNVLQDTAWRNYPVLDAHGCARAAIEMLSVHFSEKIITPACAYLLFGLPGFLAAKSIVMMQETMAGHADVEQGFGKSVQFLHMLLTFIPVRIAVLLWACAALLLPFGYLPEKLRLLSGALFAAPGYAVTLMAAAASLNVSLGGPSSLYYTSWVGRGTAKPSGYDIKRALWFFAVLHLLLLLLLGLLL